VSDVPKAVIHINFMPEELLFEPRRIWTALDRAEKRGTIDPLTREHLLASLGNLAIHLATRDYMIRAAVRQLQQRFQKLGSLIQDKWIEKEAVRIVGSKEISVERDHLLVAVDSFLFEFRAYLELLAKLVYQLHCGIGHSPPKSGNLSTGRRINICTSDGRLLAHNFLLFLCDRLSLPTEWYAFLVKHRNFFTHEASPYVAVEDRLVVPSEYDLIVMRTNIQDFATAARGDYFRLSECVQVVEGLRLLSRKTQEDLIEKLEA
jgi:hypothetical protein